MLSDADAIGQKYALEIGKKPPPSQQPLTRQLLNTSSVWLSIDLNTLAVPSGQTAFQQISQDLFWQIVQDLNIEAIHLNGLKEGDLSRTAFAIDPKWGQGWTKLMAIGKKHGVAWIGELIGSTTGAGTDFELAIQKVDDYPDLYHLVSIDQKDWNLLPSVPAGATYANVPWLQLEDLKKKGYVPTCAQPYVKESAWNATGKIAGADGQVRRWIYLKEKQNYPVLSWLSPSFAAGRLAAGDALNALYRYGQKILCIDANLPAAAKENEVLWIRKIGGFTVQRNSGSLKELQGFHADMAFDTMTRPALLHALVAEDARALRLIYQLYLHAGIATTRLVHALEPFDQFACDWTEFLLNPKQNYLYGEEMVTGALLRERLLKEDLLRLGKESRGQMSTWCGYCAYGIAAPKEFEKKQEEIQKAHLLLAFTYAMQPGAFSLSLADLAGTLPQEAGRIDPISPNQCALYASIPCQLQNPRSFSSQLKNILAVRKKSRIALGELIAVPKAANAGVLLLLHRLPDSRFLQLLAVNFSRRSASEQIEVPALQDTWAIDLMCDERSPEKDFHANLLHLDLPPLSGKVLLFQPKYTD